jgi:DNA-binding NarL/FixJ family response regulator
MSKVRILLADDHELVRQGLASVLRDAHPDWEIVGEAANGRAAIELGVALRPDVAILDLAMPEPNGLKVTEQLAALVPEIRIMVLTIHTAEPVMRQLRRAGARAFLAKNEAPAKLVAAVERMLAGEIFFASESASRHASTLPPRERVPVQYLLTPRELDVLRMLAAGLSNKEAAGKLDMSVRTVESHRASILSRLGVDSIGELVALAVRDGLI